MTLKSLGPRRTEILVSVIICIGGLLCYLPLLHRDFSFVAFDDDIAVYLNPHIRSLDWASIRWIFTDVTYARRYIPLNWLGFAINYRLGGLDPLGYHAVNLTLHLLNGVLLFWLVRMLLTASRSETAGPERRIDVIAGVAALLWVVHPLRVESVAWAAARLYPQSVFFLLICLVCYVHAAGSAVSPFRSLWYWGSVLAYAASLCSHQIAFTLVGVFCVLDLYPLRRLRAGHGRLWDGPARRVWLEKLPFVVAALAIVAITLWARSQASGLWDPPPTLQELPLSHRVMQSFYIWAHYIWKPWAPLHLSPVYTTLVSFDPASPAFVVSAVLVVAVTVLAIGLRRRYPVVLAAWSCHLILLVPVLGLFEKPHYPSDRYSYLQGMVWSVVVAAGLVSLGDRVRTRVRPLALFVAPACLLVAAAFLTSRQARVWTNSETLFRHMLVELGTDPYRADIHWRLGKHYLDGGRFAAAIAQFDQTLGLVPEEPRTLFLKGLALLQMAKSDELFLVAADLLDRSAARRLNPDALGAAGLAYAYAGKYLPAEDRLVRGLQLSPGDVRLRLGLGMVFHRQGKFAAAREQLELAIRDAPELAAERAHIIESWGAINPTPDE